jgi:hypothetical protein
VREAALDALLTLYKNADNLVSMHEFSERFKDRFLELANDVDDDVAVKGVRPPFPFPYPTHPHRRTFTGTGVGHAGDEDPCHITSNGCASCTFPPPTASAL